MSDVVVVEAVRTPLGRKDGALSDQYPEDLIIAVLDALVSRTGVDPDDWDGFRLGCANQEDEQGRNLARQALLAGGYPHDVPAATTNRLCGSSLTALIDASRAIATGNASILPVAGVEHMSRVAFSDWLHPNIVDQYGERSLQMGQTAETIAREHDISRERQDEFALRSHERAIEAWEDNRYEGEVISVEDVSRDGGPRPDTSMEALRELPTVFRDDEDATVTPGNAAPITDGAAGLLLMSRDVADAYGLDPLGSVGASATVGVDPRRMGRGPIPATEKSLQRAGTSVSDLDLIELNEAFAAQALHCIDELGLPLERVNVNGGAIALGHPLGCSGARIVTTLLHELNRR
ncbi:MAG: acetyl-CoA C-acyltransferase, partial [Halobacteriaceae archaeon]